jgi:hypothetical protein
MQFEKYKMATFLNHFPLKGKLYATVLKKAFNEPNQLKILAASKCVTLVNKSSAKTEAYPWTLLD